LCARQNDGVLAPFPIWNDVQTFDGTQWRGRIDVVSGGFPCQDISAAGKGAGIDGARSGMWFHMARIIREVRPQYAFVENSPMLTSRGLGRVLGDLAAMGYDARWGVLGAVDAGAPHKRDRIWIVCTDANSLRELQPQGSERLERGWVGDVREDVAYANGERRRQVEQYDGAGAKSEGPIRPTRECIIGRGHSSWWRTEPNVGRVAHGMAARVDRLRCIGNGQVPAVAALAWDMLTN
jgi:DNA (cytosine-5)-methyltransferase 1